MRTITNGLREYADVFPDDVAAEINECADAIDLEYGRRLESQSRELVKAFCRYMRGVISDYERGSKRRRADHCKPDETEQVKCWVKDDKPGTERVEIIHVMECDKCGHTYEHVNGDYRYCPHCGRRIR